MKTPEDLKNHLQDLQKKGETDYKVPIDLLLSMMKSIDSFREQNELLIKICDKQGRMLQLAAGVRVNHLTQKR